MTKPVGKLSAVVITAVVLFSLAAATDLQNIESITPQGSQVINVTGETIIGPFDQNHLELQSGNTNWGWRLETNDKGSGTVPFTLEKKNSGSYSNVLKATQNSNIIIPNGYLDMSSNKITGISNLEGSNIVNSSNIDSGAVSTTELNTGDVDDRYLNRDSSDSMQGNLDLNSNNIQDVSNLYSDDSSTNFFDGCSSGSYVESIGSDGSVTCATDNTGDGSNSNELQNLSEVLGQGNSAGSYNINMNDNQIKNLNLQNVNSVEMDGDIYGSGFDVLLGEIGKIEGPKNGDTDLNIQTQGSGSHQVSIEDGANSNQDIARFKEGGNVDIPNGNLDVSSPSNTGSKVDVGGSLQTDSDIKTFSGNVGSNGRMCIGDRCA